MADGWEVAELVAALDPGIADRLMARHPAEGRCPECRRPSPCPTRSLAEAAHRAARS